MTLGLVPCLHGDVVFACALGSGGILRAWADDVAAATHDSGFYATVGGRGGADVGLCDHLWLRFHADLLAVVVRPRIAIADREVWHAPPLSGALGVGVVARFT